MSDDEIENCETANQESVTHDRYRAAVNHPIRRAILEALQERGLTVEEIASKTGLTHEALGWHLAVLESGMFACVEKENAVYRLTKAGRVINYLE
jgi:DNA-binding transcriptional ArsR family regulator